MDFFLARDNDGIWGHIDEIVAKRVENVEERITKKILGNDDNDIIYAYIYGVYLFKQ